MVTACCLGASLLGGRAATADNLFGSDEGKFLLTAGFNDLEGSGGGGLVPLAFISGYGSSDSWGASAQAQGGAAALVRVCCRSFV